MKSKIEGVLLKEVSYHTYLVNAMAEYKGLVYVGCASNDIFVYDPMSFKMVCTFKNKGKQNISCRGVGSMVVYKELLYIAELSWGYVTIWDENGYLGRINDINDSADSMVIYNNYLYIVSGYGCVNKCDGENIISKVILLTTNPLFLYVHNNLLHCINNTSISIYNQDDMCVYSNSYYSFPPFILNYKIKNIIPYKGDLLLIYRRKKNDLMNAVFLNIGKNCIYYDPVIKNSDFCIDIKSVGNKTFCIDNDFTFKIYGEFYPHLRDQLPQSQKDKIQNWQLIKPTNLIQKDIHFLFERELLE